MFKRCAAWSMRTPLIAVLSHGVSLGLAFAPSGLLPIGTSRCAIPGAAATTAVVAHRRPFSIQLLFSPEHGDHAGPIAVVSPKKVEGNVVATTKAGGWGAWKKVVSQREEQDRVLQKFSSEGGVTVESGLIVRTGKRDDMMSISHLCVDTFRGPFEWFMLPLRLFQEFSFFGQVNGRLGRVTRNEIQHSMVVVEDAKSGKVVGFLEIGMLPKPTSSEESSLAGAAVTAAAVAATSATTAAAAATTLAAAAAAEKKPSETDSAGVGTREKDDREREGAGSTAIERPPDVAYLANVVVDKRQRRRGIGRTMINSALDIVRDLWPEEERIYVSVEQGNDIALALYEGMGFELAALEDDLLAKMRKRPARVYLCKTLR